MIRGTTAHTGAGAAGTTHGITEATGAVTHGILTTPDGTEDGIRTGVIITIITVRDMVRGTDTDMAEETGYTSRAMRPKDARGCSPAGRRQQDAGSAQAAA